MEKSQRNNQTRLWCRIGKRRRINASPTAPLKCKSLSSVSWGLDLEAYFSGTLNISISPHQYKVKQAKYTFENVKWAENEPAEDFSFFDCRILLKNGEVKQGLIYYPHPDTKPEHFQAADILEIITFKIDDLKYDDEVILEVDSQQIEII